MRKVDCTPRGEAGRGSVLAVETASGGKPEWGIAHWEPRVELAFIARGRLYQCVWCFELPVDSAPGGHRVKLSLEWQCKPGAGLLLWWPRWRLRDGTGRIVF